MPKPPSQDRSRRRREELLRAAIELMAEGGAKAVTHRAVAERAGLPAASTTYYFESIDELTDEALRLHATERVEEIQALALAAAQDANTVESIARRLAKSLAERDSKMVTAQFAIYLEAGRNPGLRTAVAEALEAFERLAEALLQRLGAPNPAATAGAFVSIIDGFALHQVANPRDTTEQAQILFETLRALFITQVMDEAELARWYRHLREPLPELAPPRERKAG